MQVLAWKHPRGSVLEPRTVTVREGNKALEHWATHAKWPTRMEPAEEGKEAMPFLHSRNRILKAF